MWDTYVHHNSETIPSAARALHALQSSHRKETAERHYIVPTTSQIDFYNDTLKKVGISNTEDNTTPSRSIIFSTPSGKGSSCSTPPQSNQTQF